MNTFFKSLITAFSIVIYGCDSYEPPPECGDSTSYPFWKDWQEGGLISIIDDSLAILVTRKEQIGCVKDLFLGNVEQVKGFRSGLFLVNYRTKQKPLLGDTLNYGLRVFNNHFENSSVLVFSDNNEKFGFWEVGKKTIELKNFKSNSNSYVHLVYKAIPWVDGNILLKSKHQIAPEYRLSILNPKNGQVEPFAFSGEYEWLAECAGMSYINNKIVCIRKNTEANYFELVANNIVTDTSSLYKYYAWYGEPDWYGNYAADLDNIIHKIDTLTFKFDRDFKLWYRFHKFYNDIEKLDDFVLYSGEYLTGRK
jgi:hypothetical protein